MAEETFSPKPYALLAFTGVLEKFESNYKRK